MMEELWQRNPTKKQVRDFGFLVGSAFLVFGSILAWRHPARGLHPWLWVLGATLVIGAAIAPRFLAVPYRLWMAFAFLLGLVMTNVILTITFLFAFTLIGLVMRLAGRDPLEVRWAKGRQPSYWKQREPIDVPNRHLKPF